MSKKTWIAILIPVVILLGMTVRPLVTIVSGEEIILQTRPVDPRDIFRGDYVVLSYEIEEIDLDKVEDELKDRLIVSSFPYDRKIYVTLKENNGVHIVDRVTATKPSDVKYFMEAKYKYLRNKEKTDEKAKLIVSYNIDKYFVPENTGKELEEAARNGELMAEVKISEGYAILRKIYSK